MIRTIIVDDDPLHLDSLIKLLNAGSQQIDLQCVCYDALSAIEKIDKYQPQLVFLDIEMPPYSGFDVLERVKNRNFEVIFTTSYQQYALQAIKASALDYIEKPVDSDKLAEALNRFEEKNGRLKMNNLISNFKLSDENQKIALYDKGGLNFVKLNDIVRCQTDNAYTEFLILQDKKSTVIQVTKGLSCFEDFLTDKGMFFRVHNQHLININHIKRFVKDNGGYLIMDDNPCLTIPIARARKDDFVSFLKLRGIII
jgi:two-component system, LytTR family, response regulator